MTQQEPPAPARWQEAPPQPSVGSDLGRAIPVALRRGLTVSFVALLLGQLPPLAVNLGGGGLAIVTQLRMGWLYTVAANVGAIRIEELSGSSGDPVVYGVATFRLALLTFTAVIVWMLVRAGAASARQVTDRPSRRAFAGALVAVPYAAPLAILAVLVDLRLATGGGFLPDVTNLSAVVRDMLLVPFLGGAVIGAFGGLHTSTWWRGRTGDVLAAGWRTFMTALLASVLGLLSFAALRPAGLDAYVQELRSLSARGSAITVGHQALVLPNQAAMVLVPAMGACDTVTVDGVSSDVLCLDRLPDERSPLDWLSTALDDRPGAPTAPAPWSAKVLLLVPLIAVVVGARRVVRDRPSFGGAAIGALGAAVVFGALVVGLTWASTVVLTTTQVHDDTTVEPRVVALGAEPLIAGIYAAGWGGVVGVPTACGTALLRRRRGEIAP